MISFRCLLTSTCILVFVSPSLADDFNTSVANAVESALTQLDRRGLSGCVRIECNGDVVLRRGFGYADRSRQLKMDPRMRFDIGSVSKPIVAAAVMRQVGADILSLKSTLGDVLPDVPEDKQDISIEQLLAHTSGLSRDYQFTNTDLYDRKDVTRALLAQPLAHEPGEKHEYSNANYFLLAAILESVGTDSYKETVRKMVFAPLAMKTAGFTGDKLADNEISPKRYEYGKSVGTMADWPHTWGHRGATGILGSVDDLTAFAQALHTNKLFNDADRRNWLTVRKSYYSLGWSVLELPNQPKIIAHGGSSHGARSLLAYFPGMNVTLVVLLNTTDGRSTHEWTILRIVSAAIGKHQAN